MKRIFFALTLVLSPISFADDDVAIAEFADADSNRKEEIVEVCSVQSHVSGDSALLKACDKRTSYNGCLSGGWIAWVSSQDEGSKMYSTALTALVAEKKVAVRLDGSSCLGSYDATSIIRLIK